MDDRETAIRQRAYDLWVEAGRPEGEPEQYWLQAERDLADDDPSASGDKAQAEQSDKLDQELEDSSPASDPPSKTQP